MALPLAYVPHTAASALMLSLAALLLWHGIGRPANRLLALALACHGVSSLAYVAGASLPDDAQWLERARRYAWLAIAPAFIAFAAYYPRPRRLPGPRALTPLVAGLGIAAFPLLYLAEHDLYASGGRAGPLLLAARLLLVAYGLIAWRMLRAWSREPEASPARDALLTTGLAFALIHLYDAVSLFAWDALGTLGVAFDPASASDPRLVVIHLVGLAAYVPFLALLARERSSSRGLRVARVSTLAAVLLALGLAGAVAAARAAGSASAIEAAEGVWTAASGLWDLTFPAILAYAVLRHQLLDVDVKLRWTISKSTTAAIFIAVFFLASEGAQIFFGRDQELVGLAAAGALVFAMTPLQRAAERLAERAVPVATSTGATPALPAARGAQSYRRAVRFALRDRKLSHDEEVELATIAHDLGLSGPDATRIRLEVEREMDEGGERA